MKPKLLLPVKDKETLIVALDNGADEIYLGVKQFNARISATNFELNELKDIIDFCHKKGVRVYITLNTLIKNNELKSFFDILDKIYLSNADAIIIQEISFAKLIKESYPDLEIHASTQARIGNSNFINNLKYIDRIILPRELSKDEINQLLKKINKPIEVFVHGALCFSYSGLCLFSSIIGGRSGNRGFCAQPCRKKYNSNYLLCMKDLKLIESIKELEGICSIKVEGRLRNKFYVATVGRVYRKVLDKQKINNKDIHDIYLAFNREFTTGFFGSDNSKTTIDSPTNRGVFLGTYKDGIRLKHDLCVGDGIGVWKKDKIVGLKINKLLTNNKKEIKYAKKDDFILIVSSKINNEDKIYKTSIRDKQILSVDYKRKEISKIKRYSKTVNFKTIINKKNADLFNLYVKVYNIEDLKIAYKNKYVSCIFYSIDNKDILPAMNIAKDKLFVYLPTIVSDEKVDYYIKLVNKLKPKGVLINNVVFLNKFKELNVICDYGLNIFNDIDLNYFKKSIISVELNLNELKNFQNKNFIVLVHGNINLMYTLNPLPEKLKDEKGFEFYTKKEFDYNIIVNSKQIGLFDKILELKKAGITQFYLDLDKNVSKWLDIYSKIIDNEKINIKKISKGFTTGHFNRGVF
jgi:collagenase-like PrtC family protease